MAIFYKSGVLLNLKKSQKLGNSASRIALLVYSFIFENKMKSYNYEYKTLQRMRRINITLAYILLTIQGKRWGCGGGRKKKRYRERWRPNQGHRGAGQRK